MECTARITPDLLWVGGNDRRLNLFENIFPIPRGVSYNSYLLLDEKTVLVDTVDKAISGVFFDNLTAALDGRQLNYIVVNHMEPDHAATLAEVCGRYPGAQVMLTAKGAQMAAQFFGDGLRDRLHAVSDGAELVTGRHHLRFFTAPMVHWPEVMVTWDETDRVLFSADAFGAFGAVSGFLFADEVDFARDWLDDARRYYTNIVGKYGAPVQALLKKAAALDIAFLCPLHGPVWRRDIAWFVEKYQRWSTYRPEEDGVLVAYASIYGHTENAAEVFAMALRDAGVKHVAMYDVSVTHPSYILSDAFRFGKLALLSATYNLGVFPAMETLLLDLKAHALQDRTVALVENAALSTALQNDVGGGISFAQQVYGLGRQEDVLLFISTSGNAGNAVAAAMAARARGMRVALLSGGTGGKLRPLCDVSVVVGVSETFMVQELHLPVYHALCLMLEYAFFPPAQ